MSSGLIAVGSGKGGVGKTWLAVTLAHALARRGRRVLLVDGDLGLANIDVHLGFVPRRDMLDVVSGGVMLASVVEPCPALGCDVIMGRSASGGVAMPAPSLLARLGRELAQTAAGYQHTVLDLGGGIDRAPRMLAGLVQHILLVVTEEPASITDAYAFAKFVRAAELQERLLVVVNQASGQREGEAWFAALARTCRHFLGFAPPLVGVIRHDPRVGQAVRAQTPLLTRSPSSVAARDLETLAARMEHYTAPAAIPPVDVAPVTAFAMRR